MNVICTLIKFAESLQINFTHLLGVFWRMKKVLVDYQDLQSFCFHEVISFLYFQISSIVHWIGRCQQMRNL